MKAGDLQKTMAGAMLVPASIVKVAMRVIREGGKLTTGAHGVNAPDMTYLDAARVLISFIVEESPGRRAIDHVDNIGGIKWSNSGGPWFNDPFTIQTLIPEFEITNFETALAGLIKVFAEARDTPEFVGACKVMLDGQNFLPACEIEISPSDQCAQIDMKGAIYTFGGTLPIADSSPENNPRFRLGRQARCFVNQEVIARIADGFVEGGGMS